MNATLTPPPFWIVWEFNGRAPAHQHPTEAHAEADALRLAQQNPAREYFVMEPVSLTKLGGVVAERFTRIPF